jgi:transposase
VIKKSFDGGLGMDSTFVMIGLSFLTDAERLELRALLRRVRGEALALRRANILLLLDKGWSFAEVAEALFLESSTIEAVQKAYNKGGIQSLYAVGILGRPAKLGPLQRATLSAHLSSAHYATSQQVRDHICLEYGVVYSRAGIIAFLKTLGFVHQKTTLVSPVVPEAIQQEAMNAYAALKATLPADEVIVHVDGVHPTHMAKTGKVWVRRGEKLHIPSNTGRKRINIHGALNVATGQFTFMNNLTIDALSTIQLFKNLEAAYKDKSKIHVFLDNARYHYSKAVKEWLTTRSKRIILHFLPAYCPHLNPIERLWHILHTRVTCNKYYKTYNAFSEAVMTFCRTTIKSDWDNIKSYVTDNFSLKSNRKLTFI